MPPIHAHLHERIKIIIIKIGGIKWPKRLIKAANRIHKILGAHRRKRSKL
jgi:hypothetical protein